MKLVEEYQAATRENYVSWDPTTPVIPPGGAGSGPGGLEPAVRKSEKKSSDPLWKV